MPSYVFEPSVNCSNQSVTMNYTKGSDSDRSTSQSFTDIACPNQTVSLLGLEISAVSIASLTALAAVIILLIVTVTLVMVAAVLHSVRGRRCDVENRGLEMTPASSRYKEKNTSLLFVSDAEKEKAHLGDNIDS